MRYMLTLLSIGLGCVLVTSCSTKPQKEVIEDIDYVSDYSSFAGPEGFHAKPYSTDNPGGIIGASYRAADALLKIADAHLQRSKPILVASFVNIDNVLTSSTFGRMAAEQIGSRLAQYGYPVVEMKMRTNSVFVQERTGELLLSRRLRDISLQHDAFAVVVGTYAEGKRRVYVTAKLIRAEDSVILASYDYELPVGPDTKTLLRSNQRSFRPAH